MSLVDDPWRDWHAAEPAPVPPVPERLDWYALWEDDAAEEFILDPLLPARRSVTIYSAPKVGKSLLVLEIAVALANGTRVLGAMPDRAHNVSLRRLRERSPRRRPHTA